MTDMELIDKAKRYFEFLPECGSRWAYECNRKKLDGMIADLYARGYEVLERVAGPREIIITRSDVEL